MSERPEIDEYESQWKQRLEFLDGMIAAMADPHRLMEIVDGAADAYQARRALMQELGLNEIQAIAVLDLQVRRFAAEERRHIADERTELLNEARGSRVSRGPTAAAGNTFGRCRLGCAGRRYGAHSGTWMHSVGDRLAGCSEA